MMDTPQVPPLTSDPFQAWLIAAITRLEGWHQAMHTELLGNGQPGRIQRLEEKLDTHIERTDGEINGLTKKVWYTAGGSSVILALLKLLHIF